MMRYSRAAFDTGAGGMLVRSHTSMAGQLAARAHPSEEISSSQQVCGQYRSYARNGEQELVLLLHDGILGNVVLDHLVHLFHHRLAVLDAPCGVLLEHLLQGLCHTGIQVAVVYAMLDSVNHHPVPERQ